MILFPENLKCELCEVPASVALRDLSTGKDHAYCISHQPETSQRLVTRRYRSRLGDLAAEAIAADEDSPEHRSFYVDMCELQLLGGHGACLYYLSRLTNSNQFELWSDEFLANAREFVLAETNGAAADMPFELGTVCEMEPLFRLAFEKRRPSTAGKQTKQDHAVVLLLNHPDWSDQQIATEAPTTLKQLQRNTRYTALRAYMNRDAR